MKLEFHFSWRKYLAFQSLAFSLVELVIVIGIMAIILTLALANYHQSNQRTELLNMAQKIVSDFRLAQSQSSALIKAGDQIPVGGWGLHFDLAASSSYKFFADINGDGQFSSGENDLTIGGREINFPSSVKIIGLSSGNSLDVTFSTSSPVINIWDGSATTTAATILLQEGTDKSLEIVKINNWGLMASANSACDNSVLAYAGGPWNAAGTVRNGSETGYYKTAAIGTQCWLADNINVGSEISLSNSQTNNSVVEKYCQNDDPSYCATYGGLYQWAEAAQYNSQVTSTIQGICPSGWHLAEGSDWLKLNNFLSLNGDGGHGAAVGGKIKETDAVYGFSPNTCGDANCNSSNLSILPATVRGTVNGNLQEKAQYYYYDSAVNNYSGLTITHDSSSISFSPGSVCSGGCQPTPDNNSYNFRCVQN